MKTTRRRNLATAALICAVGMGGLAPQALAQETHFDRMANLSFAENRPTKETVQTLPGDAVADTGQGRQAHDRVHRQRGHALVGRQRLSRESAGGGDLLLSVDTGKLGLWPGGFLTVEAEGNFGQGVNLENGGLMPVNENQVFPVPGKRDVALPAVMYTQFLSEYFGVLAGHWVRPDDSYVISIKAVDAGGKLDASYANPNPLPFYTAEVRWNLGSGSDPTDSTLDFIIVGRL